MPHDILLRKAEVAGIRVLPYQWLTSYLEDRSQIVDVSGHLSQPVKLSYGVVQGSILGPILFIIFITALSMSKVLIRLSYMPTIPHCTVKDQT